MPIYAYRCTACGHAKDVLQRMSDAQLSVCPACGAPSFEKQVTAAGFQLKGSGWYVTDFKEGAKPAGGAAADAAKADAAPGEAAKGDAPKADAPKPDAGAGAAAKSPPADSKASAPAAAPAAPAKPAKPATPASGAK